jgi:hypothetical protein
MNITFEGQVGRLPDYLRKLFGIRDSPVDLLHEGVRL